MAAQLLLTKPARDRNPDRDPAVAADTVVVVVAVVAAIR